jgi:hypothetical protein
MRRDERTERDEDDDEREHESEHESVDDDDDDEYASTGRFPLPRRYSPACFTGTRS